MITKTKILLFDIENTPNLAYVWGKYEQNVIAYENEWNMLCFAYKWLGDKTVKAFSLPDFKGYRKDLSNDGALLKELWKLLDEADIVVGHNSDAFDIRKTNARFIANGLTPPSPYKTVDTKKLAKKHFFFNSNKLDDLGKLLGLGEKAQTGGFDLWLGCMRGDKKSWNKMVKYNKQDVVLLESVFLKLRGWATTAPKVGTIDGDYYECPRCESSNVQRRGYAVVRTLAKMGRKQRWHCQNCGAWTTGKSIKV